MLPYVDLREFFGTLFKDDIALDGIEGVGKVYFLTKHLWAVLKFFHNVSLSMR